MKKRQTCKLFSLFVALAMVMTLAVPALAVRGDEDTPVQELRMTWLDWNKDGQCYAGENALDRSNGDGINGMTYAPGRGDHVIFFIWNNETQRKEKFVIPEGNGHMRVIPVDAEGIAPDAKQSRYYVRLELDGWTDEVLTADGLSFNVTAAMNDFAFFSAQTPSQDAYLANEVCEEILTDCTVYFGSSYADGAHDTVVSVEKDANGHENLYTLEKVGDGCWKIVYKDVFAIQGDIWVKLKAEVRNPDGETREEYPELRIYHEYAPRLQFVWLDSEWSDEDQCEYFYLNPERRDAVESFEIQPGDFRYGIFGYGGTWDEDGFNLNGFTPVSAGKLELPVGVHVNAEIHHKEGAEWAEYYVALSVDERDKTYTVACGEYQMTVNSRLPDIGLYTAPEASWKSWAGPYEFPYNPAHLDEPYYIISTATDERHGRHLTGLALSGWEENELVELTQVSTGVYRVTLKQDALSHDRFHLELDLTWTDIAGNTWTDPACYLGDFSVKNAAVASDMPLIDGAATTMSPIPYLDVADKVSTNVTMTAGESKELYLYRIGFRWSAASFSVVHLPYQNYFHSDDEAFTLVQDEADFSKFTLSCAKPGVYEIYLANESYDWDNLKLYHADGTEYTQEELDAFNELPYGVENGVFVIYDEDYNPIPFAELFPGDIYELESLGLYIWEDYRVTVTVEPNYTDVTADDWFYDSVVFAAVNGMMNGDGQRFNPKGYVTREMVPTVLYRLAGEPEAATGDFTDVADNTWYTSAVSWAAETGVVKGMGGGSFGVGTPISREQLAAMLYRYAEYLGCDMSASDGLSGFADAGSVHSWAVKEMQWAVGTGIINGKGESLDPQGTATRAELAAMLARFCRDVL